MYTWSTADRAKRMQADGRILLRTLNGNCWLSTNQSETPATFRELKAITESMVARKRCGKDPDVAGLSNGINCD